MCHVVVDPGHGGLDNGAAYGYVHEDDTNLSIGFYLNYELLVAETSNILTREKDEFVSLSQRIFVANQERAELFVSIHCDAFHNQTVSGITVHINESPSMLDIKAASIFASHLRASFPYHRHRGIKQSNFMVLRDTPMPAVLIECEFLSNPDTRAFLKEPEHQRDLAKALRRGSLEYLDFVGA